MIASPAAEEMLQTWRDIFKSDDLDLHSNFFELGGNSLTASKLQTAVNKKFGVVIRTADILSNPTVIELTEKIEPAIQYRRDEILATNPNVIPLQPRGEGRPIFVISQSLIFRRLALRLGTGQPVYAIVMNEGDPVSNRSTLEKIIDFHLQWIRIVQPKGPYRLAGWCASGWLAYGMARKLELQGEQIELLVVIDATAPDYLSRCGWLTKLSYNWHRYAAARKTTSTLQLILKRMIKTEKSEEDAAADVLDETASQIQSLGPLNGNMLLFSSKDDPIDSLPCDKGWEALLGRPVEAIPLPGNHHQIFEDAGAEIMARRILHELNSRP